MIRASRSLVVLALLLATAGCAGGWRHGVPAQWAADATVSAPAASPPKSSRGPAVSADGVTFRYSGEGSSVNLAGEFNSWSTSADPLTKGADGVWTITKKLNPGRYAYKFVVDGTNWKEDPTAKETTDDGFGGKNAIIVVSGTASSASTSTTSATSAAAATIAVTGKPEAPVIGADGVRFTYAGAASSVALCGDFNGWATQTDPMKQQSDGTWTIVRKLSPGSHAYKFLIDGKVWRLDEANPSTQDDDFGGKNSVITVK